MSRNLERALEVLDVGTQASDEPAYGYDDPDRCARCLGDPPVDGDLCPGCRAFLLGDSDDDPTERPAYEGRGWLTPPPLPTFTEEMIADAIIDESVPSDRVYLLNPAYLATEPAADEVPYVVSYLTIADRHRRYAAMFAAAEAENLAELRARGWNGLYFHRRMAEPRPPGATSTRWTVMTRGLRLGR